MCLINPNKPPNDAVSAANGEALLKEPIMSHALDHRRSPSLFAALGAAALRVLRWPARVIEARRTLNQLAGMSDFELCDIGLSRQDLANVTARPLDEDPTSYLVSARAARAGRRH